jgi:hypothetical protein
MPGEVSVRVPSGLDLAKAMTLCAISSNFPRNISKIKQALDQEQQTTEVFLMCFIYLE